MNSILKNRIKKIKLIIFDVDGVLTDGSIYISDDGYSLKKFDVKDGVGITLSRRNGIKIIFLSAKGSVPLQIRARDLKITALYENVFDKKQKYDEIKSEFELEDYEIAYVGDDIVDLPVMESCGVAFAVADAHFMVKDIADIELSYPGGAGAVREVCELILSTQKSWDEILNNYYNEGKKEYKRL